MGTIITTDFVYVEVATDGVYNRNIISKIDDLHEYKYSTDTFRSLFVFNQEILEYLKKHNTVAHYDGICYIDNIIFDIDSEDLEDAQYKAIRLIEKLGMYDVNPSNLAIYFSGCKGFHIHVPARWFDIKPDVRLPEIVAEMAKEIAGDVKIDTSIYNKLRLIRLPLTKHSKTGLYKYPLSYEELIKNTPKDIMKMAKYSREDITPAGNFVLDTLKELYLSTLSKLPQGKKIEWTIDVGAPVKKCYAKIFQGVSKGLRNNAAIRVASYLAKQGLPPDIIYKIVIDWNKKNTPPLDEKELQNIVKSAIANKYDFGCNDEFLRKFCSDDCYLYSKIQEHKEKSTFVSMSSLISDYKNYVKKRTESNIKLGINGLDNVLDTISGGDCMYIVARPSVGKTALAVYIALSMAKSELKTNFITLEMTKEKIFERISQAYLHVDKKNLQIMLDYPDIEEKIIKRLSYIYVNKANSLSTIDVDRSLAKNPVDVVIIDYLGLVKSKIDSAYERVSKIARELQVIAKKHNVFTIVLAQASRKAGDGTKPLTLDMIRDSGVVEEAADYVITMWKPDLFQDIVYLDLVKNRHGASGIRVEGILDGNTMTWQFQKLDKRSGVYDNESVG